MLIQAEENRMQFAQLTLAVCFIGVINSMSYIAMHEYKALTQFNWQMQSLFTEDHPYRVQQFKTETKLFIEQAYPSGKSLALICDKNLYAICHLLQTEQIHATEFVLALGQTETDLYLKLQAIRYLESSAQPQAYYASYTPANSVAKINRQFKILLGTIILNVMASFFLGYEVYQSKYLSRFVQRMSYSIILIPQLILLYAFTALISS